MTLVGQPRILPWTPPPQHNYCSLFSNTVSFYPYHLAFTNMFMAKKMGSFEDTLLSQLPKSSAQISLNTDSMNAQKCGECCHSFVQFCTFAQFLCSFLCPILQAQKFTKAFILNIGYTHVKANSPLNDCRHISLCLFQTFVILSRFVNVYQMPDIHFHITLKLVVDIVSTQG